MNKRGEGVSIILQCGTTLSGKAPIYRLADDDPAEEYGVRS